MDTTAQIPAARFSFSDLADQLKAQPDLFPASGEQPVEVEVVRAAQRFPFTGTTVARDERRALAIAVARLAGVSKRRIAKELGCSRNTVDLVVEVLEKAGKLEPVKERLPGLLARAAEDATEWIRELIDKGEVSTEVAATIKALGVVAGIGADKVAAASAVAGDLHLHQHVHMEGSDPMRAWLQERARALSTDSEAVDADRNTLDVSVSPVESNAAAALAADAVPPEATQVAGTDQVESSAAESAAGPAPAPEAGAGGGGGGSRERRRSTTPMAQPSDTF